MVRLEAEVKQITHAIRMAAYNTETALARSLHVERRSGFPWQEAVAAPGTPMATTGQAGSSAAAPCR
jgi:hypothetical protein